MTALPHRPGVLRPRLLPQRVQHRPQRGGALRGQVPGQLPALPERHIQADRPVLEPVIPVRIGPRRPPPYLLRQRRQVREVRAAGGGGQQDRVRARPVLRGQQVRPPAHRPGPRRRQVTRRQRAGDGGVRVQPPHPRHRRRGRVRGDPGLPPQPALRRPVPVILKPAAGVERGQHPGPRRGVRRLSLLQRPQAIRLLRSSQPRRIHTGHRGQRGPRHRHRISSRRRRRGRRRRGGRRRARGGRYRRRGPGGRHRRGWRGWRGPGGRHVRGRGGRLSG